MDRKRKSTNASSTPTKKRAMTPRAADVKVVKVPNRRAGPGGFTIVATPRARIGDSGVIDGVRYVVRSEQQLRTLVIQKKWRDVERTCTSRITNMAKLFESSRFNGNIESWDTSNVTNMNRMFYNALSFNKPISGWDTSKVTTMAQMFQLAQAFNQPLGHWDTSNVTSMLRMFDHASVFNQPIGRWNTSKVDTMAGMFESAKAFDQSIGGWDTGRVMTMGSMFYDARAFNKPVGLWDVSRVFNMQSMFRGASEFNQPLDRWNTSRVKYMSKMFSDATSFNQPIASWNVRRVKDMEYMFHGARSFGQDLSAWAPRLRRGIEIDQATRELIGNPQIASFRARRYRLHPEVNAIDPVMMNRVNLDDAVVIAGDLHGDRPGGPKNKLRHIFSRETMSGIFNSGRTPKHPWTQAVISPAQVVPLRNVLHANDAAIYNRVGTPAGKIRTRTVRQVRESNARNAQNARNARNARNAVQ